VKLPRLPEDVGPTPTVTDVTALLRACGRRKGFEGVRNAALVMVALDTGARANELRTLRMDDLNTADRVVRLTGKARPGQPPAVRFAPLSPGTLKKVRTYLGARRDIPGDVLFCDRHGLMLSRRGFCEVMERLRARAGVAATWHGIRRAFLTESLRAGCPEEVLRRIAGHRDTRMLRRYAALRTCDLVRFHDRSTPTRFLGD
jgi:integrase/recombinase XerD